MSDLTLLRGDSDELSRVSGLLSRGAEDLCAGLSDTDAEVSKMRTGWRGDAGGAYESAWRDWHDGAARIQAGLALMSALLGRAGAAYQQQEATSSDALRTSQ